MKCGGRGRDRGRAGRGGAAAAAGPVRFKRIGGAFPATYFEKMA
jgi:hypothetical protein